MLTLQHEFPEPQPLFQDYYYFMQIVQPLPATQSSRTCEEDIELTASVVSSSLFLRKILLKAFQCNLIMLQTQSSLLFGPVYLVQKINIPIAHNNFIFFKRTTNKIPLETSMCYVYNIIKYWKVLESLQNKRDALRYFQIPTLT